MPYTAPGKIRRILSTMGDSGQSVTGNASAPAAGAAVVTGTPTAGTYTVTVTTFLAAGAPAAADLNNMELRAGATVIAKLPVAQAINFPIPQSGIVVTLDGATALSVNAIGNATAAVVYAASYYITQIG